MEFKYNIHVICFGHQQLKKNEIRVNNWMILIGF